MQSVLNPPEVVDLPVHMESICALKLINSHFKHLIDQYHTVDDDIVRIETQSEPVSDDRIDQLKRRRVHLKDELTSLIILKDQLTSLIIKAEAA